MLYIILWCSVIHQQVSAIGTPICLLPPRPPSHLPPHPTLQPVPVWVPWVLRQIPTAICFTHGIVNFYVTLPYISSSPPLLLCLFLHCCPGYKFISAICSDSIYMYQYMIFIFLFSDLTLYNGFQFVHPLQQIQMCSFMAEWFHCINVQNFFTHSSVNGHLAASML